jgi:hypothetical protein
MTSHVDEAAERFQKKGKGRYRDQAVRVTEISHKQQTAPPARPAYNQRMGCFSFLNKKWNGT